MTSRYFNSKRKQCLKRWKTGEMKAWLAEQKALEQGAINRVEAAKQQAYYELWTAYIKTIYLESITKDLAYKAFKQGAFSPAEPVEKQYQTEKRRLGLPLVLE